MLAVGLMKHVSGVVLGPRKAPPQTTIRISNAENFLLEGGLEANYENDTFTLGSLTFGMTEQFVQTGPMKIRT